MPDSFFDTNVLIYVASGDPVKADRAEATASVSAARSACRS